MNGINTDAVNNLANALLLLKTPEELKAFLEDICTIKELQDLSQRFAVAELLFDGANYNAVSAATGASSATISRVNRCLMYGNNGYKIAIERQKIQSDTK